MHRCVLTSNLISYIKIPDTSYLRAEMVSGRTTSCTIMCVHMYIYI